MSTEFWIVGIIKDYHKRIKDNLWVLVLDEDAHYKLKRLSKVKDYFWIAYKYDSVKKAEVVLGKFINEKFKNRYNFRILHYVGGKFLDDWVSKDSQQTEQK